MQGRKVLVTGGAGYIGSHVVRRLWLEGFEPIVFDNFVTGHREAVRSVRVIEGDLADPAALAAALDDPEIMAVVHMAAFAYVGESVANPAKYYHNNVAGTLNLLEAMRQTGKDCLIASSSCTTYGEPRYLPIDEAHPQRPVSPYGRSKLVLEQMLKDFAHAYGSRYVIFRYFNAAGATDALGEDHEPETHLIPLVLRVALGQAPAVTVFGGDYPTPDGTCVRDYVHVDDLATAHVAAVKRLLDGASSAEYNLGNDRGFSVREVIEAVRWVTGREVPFSLGPRRSGDPPRLVASSDAVRRDLGWEPAYPELVQIIRSAWEWQLRHPQGYRTAGAGLKVAS